MHQPKVSVIIPAYNAAKYLKEAVDSVLSQTYTDLEVIVVNNGSTDDTASVVALLGDKITCINEPENKGAAFARQLGLSNASGELIQFLDADDLLAPEKIRLQIEALNGSTDVLAYGQHIDFFDGEDTDCNLPESYLERDYANGADLLFDLYGGNDKTLSGGMIPLHSWLIPASVTNVAGPWDTSLSVDDDGEYFCRILKNSGGAKFVGGSVCYYRRHKGNGNLSAQRRYDSYLSAFRSVKLKRSHLGAGRFDMLLANQAMHILTNAYPQYQVLCREIEAFIYQLGGNSWVPYQEGHHKTLRKLLGWKAVKLLSYFKNGSR